MKMASPTTACLHLLQILKGTHLPAPEPQRRKGRLMASVQYNGYLVVAIHDTVCVVMWAEGRPPENKRSSNEAKNTIFPRSNASGYERENNDSTQEKMRITTVYLQRWRAAARLCRGATTAGAGTGGGGGGARMASYACRTASRPRRRGARIGAGKGGGGGKGAWGCRPRIAQGWGPPMMSKGI